MSSVSWTEVFSALPDSAFFEIIRHYLGPMSTPFHKPDLSSRLAAFMSREDVVERVATYLTHHDAFVLSYIAIHDHPNEANLRQLLPDMKPIALGESLFNLEERLLIWRPRTANKKPLDLTPLGERLWKMGLVGPGVVIEEPTGRLENEGRRWLNDNFLNSALAFLSEAPLLFLKEGGWRKKSLDILKRGFPVLFSDQYGEERILLAGRGLIAAGLATRKDEILQPLLENWRALEGREANERKTMLITKTVVGRSLPAKAAMDAIRTLVECLPEGNAYPMERLVVLVQLVVGGSTLLSPRGARRIVDNLVLTGELAYGNDDSAGRPPDAEKGGGAALSLTPTGEISCHPGFPLSCDLALATEPVSADTVSMFKFTKQRFLAGLDAGIVTNSLFQILEDQSGRPIPPNLRILALEWEGEHQSLRLRYGVVLEVMGPRRDVMKATGVLEPYTLAKPAEGVWILNPDEAPGWRDALERVGIDYVPPLPSRSGENRCRAEHSPIPALGWSSHFTTPRMARENWSMPSFLDFMPSLETLADDPAVKRLSEEERIIFLERLERRLILIPEQIRRGAWRYEATLAKGLDYQGKLRLIKAALSGRNERLQVSLASGNSVETVTVVPENLDREDGEHILTAITLPGETRTRYMVRKIGLIKRTKASLF